MNASSLFDLEEKPRFSFSCGVKVELTTNRKVSGASLASVGLYLVTKNTLKTVSAFKTKKQHATKKMFKFFLTTFI